MSLSLVQALRRQARWLPMAMYSLFLFAAGGVCAPILGHIGELALQRFNPPSPKLEFNVIRQDHEGLELYVANYGDGSSVIEHLNVCPPEASGVINWDTGVHYKADFSSDNLEAMWVLAALTMGRLKPWRVNCHRDGLFIALNLIAGDRSVPKDDSSVVTFQPPNNFVLYSNVGRDVLQFGTVCSGHLIANNDRVNRLFPFLLSGVPIPGDEQE